MTGCLPESFNGVHIPSVDPELVGSDTGHTAVPRTSRAWRIGRTPVAGVVAEPAWPERWTGAEGEGRRRRSFRKSDSASWPLAGTSAAGLADR
jgi:hypothetical protein